jgi:TolA-binding protein
MRRAILPVVLLFCAAAPALAQNQQTREHTQILAELRINQEQQQRLMASVNALVEALKVTNANLAAQTAESGRMFAGLKAEIDAVSSAIAPLRSLLDQTRVDVGRVGPELDAQREGLRILLKYTQQIIELLTPVNPIGAPGQSADPTTPPPAPPPAASVNLPPSPQQFKTLGDGYYASGDFESAIAAFQEFLKLAPDHSDAPFVQMQIGHSYMQMSKYQDALNAFRVVTDKYQKSAEAPEAYYSMGTAYEKLPKQIENARRMYNIVVSQYPKTTAGIRAAESLKRIGPPK